MSQDSRQTPSKRPILSLKGCRRLLTPEKETPAEEAQVINNGASTLITPEAKIPRSSDEAATRLAEWLSQYSVVWRDWLPLRIGVMEDIYALLDEHGTRSDWSKKVIHKTVYWHTRQEPYLQQQASHEHRYSLMGHVDGIVTGEQQEYARCQLDAKKRSGRKNSRKK